MKRSNSTNSDRTNDYSTGDELPQYHPPSISDAREFRRNVMPRRCPDENQRSKFRLSEYNQIFHPETGEKLRLYNIISSPNQAFDEFGEGISIYFRSLKGLFVVFFICAFINILALRQNHIYNPTEASIKEYTSNNHVNSVPKKTPTLLLGSAYGAERSSLKFQKQGAADIAICFILIAVIFISGYVENKLIDQIDATLSTTKDYSVVITNPPEDVTDPAEYKKHFEKFGEVVAISIIKDNGKLLQTIATKKYHQHMLYRYEYSTQNTEENLSKTDSSKESDSSLMKSRKLRLSEITTRLLSSDSKAVIQLCDQEMLKISETVFKAYKVYITFNLESDRNECLHRTAIGRISRIFGWHMNPYAYFYGKVIEVKPPVEPFELIYENSELRFREFVLRQSFCYLICFTLLVINYYIINTLVQSNDTIGLAIFVSLSDSCLPYFIKIMTVVVERHHHKTVLERSILLKLCLVRCFNSAVLIYFTSYFNADNFTQTLDIKYLQKIMAILVADALVMPVIRLISFPTLIKQYIIGPCLAVTQEDMNLMWVGVEWTLAERYTDIMKSIFMGLFFSSILPQSLFLTSLSMLTTYLSDKYSLFYLWTNHAHLDASLSRSSKYLLMITVFVHVIMTRIFFANWPYGGVYGQDTDTPNTCSFLSCPVTSEMTPDQKRLIRLYTGLSIGVFIACLVIPFMNNIIELSQDLGLCLKEKKKADQNTVTFREINTPIYIPTVTAFGTLQPLICANIDEIPNKYLPFHYMEEEEMIDVERMAMCNFENVPVDSFGKLENMFSTVAFYSGEDESVADSVIDYYHLPTAASMSDVTSERSDGEKLWTWKKPLYMSSSSDMRSITSRSTRTIKSAPSERISSSADDDQHSSVGGDVSSSGLSSNSTSLRSIYVQNNPNFSSGIASRRPFRNIHQGSSQGQSSGTLEFLSTRKISIAMLSASEDAEDDDAEEGRKDGELDHMDTDEMLQGENLLEAMLLQEDDEDEDVLGGAVKGIHGSLSYSGSPGQKTTIEPAKESGDDPRKGELVLQSVSDISDGGEESRQAAKDNISKPPLPKLTQKSPSMAMRSLQFFGMDDNAWNWKSFRPNNRPHQQHTPTTQTMEVSGVKPDVVVPLETAPISSDDVVVSVNKPKRFSPPVRIPYDAEYSADDATYSDSTISPTKSLDRSKDIETGPVVDPSSGSDSGSSQKTSKFREILKRGYIGKQDSNAETSFVSHRSSVSEESKSSSSEKRVSVRVIPPHVYKNALASNPSHSRSSVGSATSQTTKRSSVDSKKSAVTTSTGGKKKKFRERQSVCKGLGMSYIGGGTAPLPFGWEKMYTKEGRVYFVNHIEKKTQWEPPGSTTISTGGTTSQSPHETNVRLSLVRLKSQAFKLLPV